MDKKKEQAWSVGERMDKKLWQESYDIKFKWNAGRGKKWIVCKERKGREGKGIERKTSQTSLRKDGQNVMSGSDDSEFKWNAVEVQGRELYARKGNKMKRENVLKYALDKKERK